MAHSLGLLRLLLAGCSKNKSSAGSLQSLHCFYKRTYGTSCRRASLAEKSAIHSRGGNHVLRRHFTAGVASHQKCTVHKLTSRGLVRVTGDDAGGFLQGLITNDINLITASRTAMYAMLLNVQGRVMYDLIVYNTSSDPGHPSFLIECDATVTSDLIRDIRKYKLRKKVDISDVSDELNVSAVIPPDDSGSAELSVPESECVMFTPDPRVRQFGWRLITDTSTDAPSSVGVLGTEEEYHSSRYRWGISEGCLDLPPASCFPLESNLVYLHGASFQKGCYIGQELTARTYHTGVTRKRLMPLLLEQSLDGVSPGTDIKTDTDKPAGKYRHSVGNYGLGLMRLAEIKNKLVMKTESGEMYDIQTSVPTWWPSEVEG